MFDLRTILWLIIATLFFLLAFTTWGMKNKILQEIDGLRYHRDENGQIIAIKDFTGLNTLELLGDSIIKVSTVGSIGCILSVIAAILSII